MKTGFHSVKIVGKNVDPDVYHAAKGARGSPDFVMSPSALKVFAECPARWRNGYTPPPSEAKEYGSLIDCRVLTPNLVESKYVVRPSMYVNEKDEAKKWNGNSLVCRKWLEEHAGYEVLSQDDWDASTVAVAALDRDSIVSSILQASDKQVQLAGIWHDAATGLDIPISCLIDMVPRSDSEWAGAIADLKITRNGGLRQFARWAWDQAYHLQAAINLDMHDAATGEDRTTFLWVVQESYPPFQVGRRMLDYQLVGAGRWRYQALLTRYARCLKDDHWPDYDDHKEAIQGWSIVTMEPWMESVEMQMAAPMTESEEPMPEPELADNAN